MSAVEYEGACDGGDDCHCDVIALHNDRELRVERAVLMLDGAIKRILNDSDCCADCAAQAAGDPIELLELMYDQAIHESEDPDWFMYGFEGVKDLAVGAVYMSTESRDTLAVLTGARDLLTHCAAVDAGVTL